MNAIVARATIDQIEAGRNRCLDLYGQAWDLVRGAGDAAAIAVPGGVYALPSLRPDQRHWGLASREEFLEETRRPLDRSIWTHLLRATQLDRLMDKAAKDQFRAEVENDPPPATADNCQATIERLMAESGTIFRRGIANAFSGLDRRFRSHDGFKIGSRIVLTWFANSDGYVGSGGKRDTLLDVERAFYVLDGKMQPDADGGILGALATARGGRLYGPSAYEAETDYFRVRVFKNGNAHVWFLREDLVEQVNLRLAEHYGAALAAGPEAAQADVKYEPGRHVAKNFGAFMSPPAVVERLLAAADIHSRGGRLGGGWTPPTFRVLEPSAGIGNVAAAIAGQGSTVTAVEIQAALIPQLREAIAGSVVRMANFLELSPRDIGRFERVVMNPPFDGGLDVDHVVHALQFVEPGGRLVAVMSAGVEFREDKKTAAFRALVERHGGKFQDLPIGSFAESGTMVNTVICVIPVR